MKLSEFAELLKTLEDAVSNDGNHGSDVLSHEGKSYCTGCQVLAAAQGLGLDLELYLEKNEDIEL